MPDIAGDRMELEVKDFGPVGRAVVDLRPLMVFVGPSNTGKSWLATLIYALHRYFHRSTWGWKRPRDGHYPVLHGRALDALDGPLIGELIHWHNELLPKLRKWPKDQRFALPRPIAEAVEVALNVGGTDLQEEILNSFGLTELRLLVRQGSTSEPGIVLRKRTYQEPRPLEHRLAINDGQLRLTIRLRHAGKVRLPQAVSAATLRDILIQPAGVGGDDVDMWAIHVLSQLAGAMRPFAIGPLDQRAHYLPSGRNGLLDSQTLVLRNLLQEARTQRRRSADAPFSSGVTWDFLEGLVQLGDPIIRGTTHLEGVARWLEDVVLDGAVRVKQEAGLARIAFRPSGWRRDLALANASSMASDVAPVVLYLRYLVEPGDLLIIEEPESSLHPAKQVAFLQGLAHLANTGVRVLITTHSEWMLEELANIVRRSQLPSDEHGPPTLSALSADQVGAWLFHPGDADAGAEVREIGLNDSGLYPTGFQEVAAALHNDWAGITSQLENGR